MDSLHSAVSVVTLCDVAPDAMPCRRPICHPGRALSAMLICRVSPAPSRCWSVSSVSSDRPRCTVSARRECRASSRRARENMLGKRAGRRTSGQRSRRCAAAVEASASDTSPVRVSGQQTRPLIPGIRHRASTRLGHSTRAGRPAARRCSARGDIYL